MNREHIREVRDALHTLAETGKSPVEGIDGFDMSTSAARGEYGTVACIGGWSNVIRGRCLAASIAADATEAFGLSARAADGFFYPHAPAIFTCNPIHGVAMLDWLLTQPDDVSPSAIAAKWAEVVP